MHINEFLKDSFTSKPAKGSLGNESDWLEFCPMQLRGTRVWVGDANYVPNEPDGFLVELNPGEYSVTAKAMDFGGDKRVSRLRVCLSGTRPQLGRQIGETWTDTAITGLCDHENFSEVWGDDDDVSDAIIRPALDDYTDNHGIAVLAREGNVIMPFVDSGFGDGVFPVFELLQDSTRVGFEVEFIAKDVRYEI